MDKEVVRTGTEEVRDSQDDVDGTPPALELPKSVDQNVERLWTFGGISEWGMANRK
jgi:hypothetical protein